MTIQKCGSSLPFIVGIVLGGLLTGGILYYQYASYNGDLNENMNKPVTENSELTAVTDACILTMKNGETVEVEQAYDGDTGMKMFDFAIYNHALTEVLPRLCAYQSTQNVENALCVIMEIDEKGGEPIGALKEYRDSL